MVLWPKCGCPITSYFVFFFSHSISAADVWPCLVLRIAFFLLMFIFYGGWNEFIGLAPLLPLLGPVGLPAATFIGLARWALSLSFFFSFFSLGLFSFLFLLLLTNFLLYSFFTFYWASLLFGLFKKKIKKSTSTNIKQ